MPNEGWGQPTPRKCHYYVETFSLCGRRGFYRGPLELGNDDSVDNCAECMKKLKRRQGGHDAD